jgi:hypothetical protein
MGYSSADEQLMPKVKPVELANGQDGWLVADRVVERVDDSHALSSNGE